MLVAKPTKFAVFHALGVCPLVLGQVVVATFAFTASQRDSISGHSQQLRVVSTLLFVTQ